MENENTVGMSNSGTTFRSNDILAALAGFYGMQMPDSNAETFETSDGFAMFAFVSEFVGQTRITARVEIHADTLHLGSLIMLDESRKRLLKFWDNPDGTTTMEFPQIELPEHILGSLPGMTVTSLVTHPCLKNVLGQIISAGYRDLASEPGSSWPRKILTATVSRHLVPFGLPSI